MKNIIKTFCLLAMIVMHTGCYSNEWLNVEVDNHTKDTIVAIVDVGKYTAGTNNLFDNYFGSAQIIEPGKSKEYHVYNEMKDYNEVTVYLVRKTTLLKYTKEQLDSAGFDATITVSIKDLKQNDYKIIYNGQ